MNYRHNVNCRHTVVQPISRTYSSCTTEILCLSISNFPFPPPCPTSGNHHSVLILWVWLYEGPLWQFSSVLFCSPLSLLFCHHFSVGCSADWRELWCSALSITPWGAWGSPLAWLEFPFSISPVFQYPKSSSLSSSVSCQSFLISSLTCKVLL